ncbi:M56 family metallopeptidase [Alteromonas gilva]|uniref:M56 family metallopeptidase n=1 Tax=Alteromonas gilva TaxID=2987522 RepID=A0ABT5L3K2_9ALTE|nr:M56 family metallopeptidase [Alteromonas gilva]MDC8831009.1 M56 family metallopeptidase [Alteromonas gilva]
MDRFITLLDSQFVYALGWTIVHSFWQSLIVLLLLIFTLFINKRASALTRYWLAVIALGCCFLISAKTYTYSYQDIAQAKALFSQLQSVLVADSPRSWWQWIYQTVNPWLIYIVAAWICGFALQALRYIADLVLTHQLKSRAISTVPNNSQKRFEALAAQLAIHKNIRFFQSTKVLVPCVIGHVKPVILLPLGMLSQLPHEQVEAIVLHELAHIKRNDYLMNIVQCAIKVLFFFNPFVLAISKKIDIEREHCCDDIAVKVCGSPLTFAHTLSRFADISHNSQTAVAANKNQYLLLARVKRLFGQPRRLSKSVEHTIALSCVAILGLTLNVNAGTHYTSIANETKTSAQPEQVQHVDVSEQLTSIRTTTPPPITNVNTEVSADSSLDSTAVEQQVFANKANKTDNTNEQQLKNEHEPVHSNATSSSRETDPDEKLAKTAAVSSEVAIDYLAQAGQPITKPSKHPEPVHRLDTS